MDTHHSDIPYNSVEDSEEIDALVERFGKLTPDVTAVFLQILKSHGIDDEQLFWKWESYCMKMGPHDTKLNADTVAAFRENVQEQLQNETKAKQKQQASNASKVVQKTPRNIKGSEDAMALFDGLVPPTPRGSNGSVKHKFENTYGTPSKPSRLLNTNPINEAKLGASPTRNPLKNVDSVVPSTPFSTRTNAGDTVETLNEHIPRPILPLPEFSLDADRTAWKNRVKLVVNMDTKGISFRTMHQKLSEASEIHSERIDEFKANIQEHYQLMGEQFGNPSTASPSEVIAVGRIASDALDGKLNAASIVFESSRSMGAGSRVPLKLDAIESFSLFPGQIVATRGVNASGNYFSVSEILEIPQLPIASSSAKTIAESASRLSGGALNIVIASGPYTTDDNLLFESLDEICNQAAKECPDVLILTGPFIDSEHPLIKTGDFDLVGTDALDGGTLEDLFCQKISPKIKKVERSMVLLIPSTQDAVSKHVAYPQDSLRKRDILGLPADVRCLPNPAFFSLNEIVFGISTADIIFHLSKEECRRNPTEHNPLSRLSRSLISQRNFYPLFPAPGQSSLEHGIVGPNLDMSHIRLADFVSAIPNVLVLPSKLTPSAKVVNGVVVVNGGSASKKRGPGTFVKMTIQSTEKVEVEVEGGGNVGDRVFERTRVDVLRV